MKEHKEREISPTELIHAVIKNAPQSVRREYNRTANSWLACFGSMLFQITNLLSSGEFPRDTYEKLMDRIGRLENRLFGLKQQYPLRENHVPEEIKAELFRELESLFEPDKEVMEEFRKEIAEIAAEEKHGGKTADFINTPEFHPGDLTADDLAVWLKTKAGTITNEEFEEYRKKYAAASGSSSPTRHGFMSLVGNKANAVIGYRWLEEERGKN